MYFYIIANVEPKILNRIDFTTSINIKLYQKFNEFKTLDQFYSLATQQINNSYNYFTFNNRIVLQQP